MASDRFRSVTITRAMMARLYAGPQFHIKDILGDYGWNGEPWVMHREGINGDLRFEWESTFDPDFVDVFEQHHG